MKGNEVFEDRENEITKAQDIYLVRMHFSLGLGMCIINIKTIYSLLPCWSLPLYFIYYYHVIEEKREDGREKQLG